MFINKSEAHERVLNAVEDIKACCEVEDDYTQWSDIAASSIQAFIDDLSAEALDDTCGAFREYITDGDTDRNLALGIQDALKIGLQEMNDYIGDIPETTANEVDSETEDGEEDDTVYAYETDNSEDIRYLETLKENLEAVKGLKI